MLKKKNRNILLPLIFTLHSTVLAADFAFDLEDMEPGKSVTLPTPATTIFKATSEVRLGATDRAQVVKISLVGASSTGSLKVAIFDSNNDAVQYIDLREQLPAVYTFHELSTIQIVPKPEKPNSRLKLMVESNRPLSITR